MDIGEWIWIISAAAAAAAVVGVWGACGVERGRKWKNFFSHVWCEI